MRGEGCPGKGGLLIVIKILIVCSHPWPYSLSTRRFFRHRDQPAQIATLSATAHQPKRDASKTQAAPTIKKPNTRRFIWQHPLF